MTPLLQRTLIRWPLPIHCTLSRALCGHRLSAGHGGAQRCVCGAERGEKELEDLCRVLGPFYAPAGTSCLPTFGAVSLSNSVCLELRRPWGFSPEARRGSQGASRAAPGESGLHARGKGERVLALESWWWWSALPLSIKVMPNLSLQAHSMIATKINHK